jgi:hypothetical protein
VKDCVATQSACDLHNSVLCRRLDVFNHPAFDRGGVNAQSTAFGQSAAGPTTARCIELRENLQF